MLCGGTDREKQNRDQGMPWNPGFHEVYNNGSAGIELRQRAYFERDYNSLPAFPVVLAIVGCAFQKSLHRWRAYSIVHQ